MQVLAAVAICVLIGASILVAVRLLLLHRRTGAWPEFLLGSMLLLSVGVGYPLSIAGVRGSQEWAGTCLALSFVAVSSGFSLLFVFTWRVFRPQATWARVLVAAGAITLLGKALHGCIQVHDRGVIDMVDLPVHQILLQTGPVVVAYLWTAFESLRYYGVMRRRVSLGLADVAVTDRFLLWGLMGLTSAFGVTLNTCAVLLHVDTFHSSWILLASGICGLFQTLFLVLAFVPPQSYVSWVRTRTAASAA